MDPRLIDQRRYLAALHAAASAQPDVHRCQLAALEREQALAAASDDPDTCRIASGDLFELTRAGWLDRLVAHARVAAALDDPWTAQAAAVEIAATLAARGHPDWIAMLAEGSTRAAVWHARAAQVRTAAATVVATAVRASWDRREASQVEAATAAAAAWRDWSELEPLLHGGDVAALTRAFAQPRYRQRTPWLGDGVRALIARIERAQLPPPAPIDDTLASAAAIVAAIEDDVARWRGGLATATPSPTVGGDPQVADVIAPYDGLTRLPGDAPTIVALVATAKRLVAHARGATTPQGVLAAWTEADLLADFAAAPVRANAEATLARTERWPDPILAAGARALLADLSGIRTGCDVDLVSVHHGGCAAIEADWNYALGAALLAPIDATAIAGWDRSRQAASSIAASWRVAHELAGAGASLLAIPRVDTVVRAIAGHATRGDDFGAWLGEIGHTTFGEARAWFGVRGLTVGTAAEVAAALTAAWGTPPAVVARSVRLWGWDLALDELDRPPPRPAVPGRSGRSSS